MPTDLCVSALKEALQASVGADIAYFCIAFGLGVVVTLTWGNT